MKKTLYTLAVDHYAPEITALTFPLMQSWARKIGATFHVIEDRRYPDWPAACEKLQIFHLGQEHGNDWNLFLDADALVHPDMIDPTEHVPKNTVLHYAVDVSTVRFTPDRFFRRSGHLWSPGNWCTIASDWCIDLWEMPTDLSRDHAIERIHPTVDEINAGVNRRHLLDDFLLARNAAKYGLKVDTIKALLARLQLPPTLFAHEYLKTTAGKLDMIDHVLKAWKIKA